jgi:hypothetical protein
MKHALEILPLSSLMFIVSLVGPFAIAPSSAEFGGRAAVAAAASPEEDPSTSIVAAAVRRHGFSCDEAIEAVRDVHHSEPHESVWLLACANQTYKVKFVLDRRVDIELLRHDESTAR